MAPKRRCRSGKRDNQRQPKKANSARQNGAFLFPAEVWEMILNYTQEETQLNLNNASLFFRNVLKSEFVSAKHVLFLSPGVFPSLQKYLTPSDVRNCREVCSPWNRAILNSLAHHPSHQNISDKPTSSHVAPTAFENYLDIHRFLAHFQTSHWDRSKCPQSVFSLTSWYTAEGLTTNPFPNRAVSFALSERGVEQRPNWFGDCHVFVSQLLKLFGHHIYYCTIQFPRLPVSNPSRLYLCLMSWMRFQPNLKSLRISFHGEQDDSTPERMEEILQAGYKIPTLKHLELLELNNLPEFIFNEVLRSNRHVQKLRISGIPGNGKIFEHNLPNLTTLFLGVQKTGDFLRWQRRDKGVWKLQELHLRVEEKNLYFEGGSDLDQWSKIARAIRRKWPKGPPLRVEFDFPDGVYKKEELKLMQERIHAC